MSEHEHEIEKTDADAETPETAEASETPEAETAVETETAEPEAASDDEVISIVVGVEPGETSVAFDEPPSILEAAEADLAAADAIAEAEDEDEAEAEDGETFVADVDDAEIAISLSSRLQRPENAEAAAASAIALEAVMSDLAGEGRSPAQEVCAQLFSSHVPLTAAQLAENLHLSEMLVEEAISQLEQTLAISPFGVFRRRLEVPGQKTPVTGLVLDLKPAYRRRVAAVGRPVLSPALTETLALIALNQPIGQSRLVRERGSSVYDHVKDLLKRDWIARSKKGRSYELRTTEAFAAEFGLPNEPELIKRALARAAGAEGSPDVIASERIRIEGAAGAPSPELADEARAAMQDVQNRIAELMTSPEPVEDCVVSGGGAPEATDGTDTPQPNDTNDHALPAHVLAALRAAETSTTDPVGADADPERSAAVSRSFTSQRAPAASPWRAKEPKETEMSKSTPETETATETETTAEKRSEAKTESTSRVAHLLALLDDDTTNDDW